MSLPTPWIGAGEPPAPRGAEAGCCPRLAMSTFPEWRRRIATSFVPMEVLPPADARSDRFRASISRTQLGALSLSSVRADAHRAVRSAATIARHPASYLKISCQLSGAVRVTQAGRTTTPDVGDFAAYDTSRPYELDFLGHVHCLVVQIPLEDLRLSADQVAALCAVPLGARRFLPGLAEFLRRIADDDSTDGAAHEQSGQLLGRMIALDLQRALGSWAPDPAGVRLPQLERYVSAHLSNPALSPDEVAAALFISPRQLQRDFQLRGTTFSLWLRDQRLDRAQHLLLTTDRTISAIAVDCGFGSGSDFGRSYRRRFGRSPRTVRQAA